MTVLRVRRVSEIDDPPLLTCVKIRLGPLTRSDLERYVFSKLAAAGRSEPTFTARALNRLHFSSEGVPANIDRLASLSMMAAAHRGLEIVTPDVVDGAAQEYLPVSAID